MTDMKQIHETSGFHTHWTFRFGDDAIRLCSVRGDECSESEERGSKTLSRQLHEFSVSGNPESWNAKGPGRTFTIPRAGVRYMEVVKVKDRNMIVRDLMKDMDDVVSRPNPISVSLRTDTPEWMMKFLADPQVGHFIHTIKRVVDAETHLTTNEKLLVLEHYIKEKRGQ